LVGLVSSRAIKAARSAGDNRARTSLPCSCRGAELIFNEYSRKLAQTDFQTFTAPGSAEKVALAAFMAADLAPPVELAVCAAAGDGFQGYLPPLARMQIEQPAASGRGASDCLQPARPV
jgi:hypothetical protein